MRYYRQRMMLLYIPVAKIYLFSVESRQQELGSEGTSSTEMAEQAMLHGSVSEPDQHNQL